MILGVDVSFYQDANTTPGQIDFAKMKAAGAEFAYIRAAFGTTPDEDFAYNWQAAKTAQELRGAYCFWNYWAGGPKMSKQVGFWKSLLAPDPGEMPPALDMERANSSYPELPAASVCFDALWQFHVMCKGLGRRTMLYTNLATLWERLTPAPEWAVNEVDLWLAHWYIQPEQLKPSPWKKVTLWQQGLGKGRGPEFGVESLDIDIDYFMGTREELRAYAGVSIPPTPEPEPEEPPMGLYSNHARGVFLWESHKYSDFTALKGKVDFVIVYAGQGDIPAANFKENIKQARAQLGVPVLAYVSLLPDLYQGLDFNPAKFPTGKNEKHVKMLSDSLHYASGLSERIDGIVYDFSDFTMKDGVTKNGDNWAAALAEHVTNQLYAYFKKPVYPLCKPSFAAEFTNAGGAVANLFNGWKSISYVKPNAVTVIEDGIRIPADTEGPQPPFISAWDFWWYGSQKFAGLAVSAALFLYKAAPALLYKELGFTAAPVDPDPVDPEPEDPTDPETPPATGDLAEVLAALTRIEAKLDKHFK